MITSQLYLRNDDREYIPATTWNDKVRAIFEREPQYFDEVPAKIVIVSEGVEANSFEDSLGPLIQNLCLYGTRSILEGQDYHFRIWSYASEVQITLRLRHRLAQIEGEYCGSAQYPVRELASALIDCAEKTIELLKVAQANLPGARLSVIERLEEKLFTVKALAVKSIAS